MHYLIIVSYYVHPFSSSHLLYIQWHNRSDYPMFRLPQTGLVGCFIWLSSCVSLQLLIIERLYLVSCYRIFHLKVPSTSIKWQSLRQVVCIFTNDCQPLARLEGCSPLVACVWVPSRWGYSDQDGWNDDDHKHINYNKNRTNIHIRKQPLIIMMMTRWWWWWWWWLC